MQAVRLFTGVDGESHIEDLDLPFEQVGHAMRTATEAATGVQFSRLKPTQLVDFHTAPRRQYVITLQGQVEIAWAMAPSAFSTWAISSCART